MKKFQEPTKLIDAHSSIEAANSDGDMECIATARSVVQLQTILLYMIDKLNKVINEVEMLKNK